MYLSKSTVNRLFLTGLFCEMLDFYLSDSSPIISSLAGLIVFIFYIKNKNITIKKEFFLILIFYCLILFFNNSFSENFFKSMLFLFSLSLMIASSGLVNIRNNIEIIKKNNFLVKTFLVSTFIFLGIDNLLYFNGSKDFIVNPNDVGIWSAYYCAYYFLTEKLLKDKIVFYSAIFALLCSNSKGSLFLIVIPCFIFSILRKKTLRYSKFLLNIFTVIFVCVVFYVYSDTFYIEEKISHIVEFKQKYIGGSGEESDNQRLFEIPMLVINAVINDGNILTGVGLGYATSDYIYQQIIPHNTFFVIFSHIGIIGLLFYAFIIMRSFFILEYNQLVLFLSVYLYAGMTGSVQVTRGLMIPVLVFILIKSLKNNTKNHLI